MKTGHTTTYIVNGQLIEKEKIAYETDKEAIEIARYMNLRDKTIRKVVAYKCPVCLKWHVGRSHKTITDKDKEKCHKMIQQEKILKKII